MAEGRWVAFMDCDDVLKGSFFEKALSLTETAADLCIFSFERVELMEADELVAPLMVADRNVSGVTAAEEEAIMSEY